MAESANEQLPREVRVNNRLQELTLYTYKDELGGVLSDSSASKVEKWISGRRQNLAKPLTNRLSHLNTEWMDITEEFTNLARQLAVGEYIDSIYLRTIYVLSMVSSLGTS